MSENQNLRYEKKTVYELAGATVVEEAYEYAKNYVKFLDAAKTEREAVVESVRIAEAAVFACIMTALLSATIAKYLPFDSLSGQISSFISSIEGPLVLVGVIASYLDIMLYHE